MKIKKHFTAEFKAKVAVVALTGKLPLGKICSTYKVSSSAVLKWKGQLQERAHVAFDNSSAKDLKETERKEEQLYAQIGKLQMEVDFLKKITL
jgi:transposase